MIIQHREDMEIAKEGVCRIDFCISHSRRYFQNLLDKREKFSPLTRNSVPRESLKQQIPHHGWDSTAPIIKVVSIQSLISYARSFQLLQRVLGPCRRGPGCGREMPHERPHRSKPPPCPISDKNLCALICFIHLDPAYAFQWRAIQTDLETMGLQQMKSK